ncbi:MAG: hypothetical protein GX458_09200 [Phyllobacteriaceae bacterium]|nr:hypothetical protein [Phyllobacteriaceae bacterium]
MQGDEFVSLLVCLSLLTGVVAGLRFNVRLLVWLCLAAMVIGTGLGVGGVVSVGRCVLMTTVGVVALQVGYFVALVIGAMRLAEAPVVVPDDGVARGARAEGSRPTRA